MIVKGCCIHVLDIEDPYSPMESLSLHYFIPGRLQDSHCGAFDLMNNDCTQIFYWLSAEKDMHISMAGAKPDIYIHHGSSVPVCLVIVRKCIFDCHLVIIEDHYQLLIPFGRARTMLHLIPTSQISFADYKESWATGWKSQMVLRFCTCAVGEIGPSVNLLDFELCYGHVC